MKKIILIIICFLLSGCSLLKIPTIGSPTPRLQIQQNYEKEYYRNKNEGVVYKKIIKSKEKIIPEKTFIQKIGDWIGGLGVVILF